ncbi:hypothetical protein ANOM_004775 [Aspergillus nomiae NRRL 13137]|uniref:Uncharacterized protein n=1 Tax=Aspergillus nomiae NRRL (strain ATCC 15546 / NRRL 13137 / CBS 260.88 / M93) TaxID=1509407 RepID=A0A0L1J4W8_ASPN3|nr:uncharacterized protein ANOM_004775 [Aspergillus nomiae NRRL 13137]KNG86789.1 hypothetical protein ANOM_004775 [Aspergillus nomiae NRRL 13137]
MLFYIIAASNTTNITLVALNIHIKTHVPRFLTTMSQYSIVAVDQRRIEAPLVMVMRAIPCLGIKLLKVMSLAVMPGA